MRRLLLLVPLLLAPAPGSSVSATLPPAPNPAEGRRGSERPMAGASGRGAIPKRSPLSGWWGGKRRTLGLSAFKDGWDLATSGAQNFPSGFREQFSELATSQRLHPSFRRFWARC